MKKLFSTEDKAFLNFYCFFAYYKKINFSNISNEFTFSKINPFISFSIMSGPIQNFDDITGRPHAIAWGKTIALPSSKVGRQI